MSIENYLEAKSLIENNNLDCDSEDGVSREFVSKLEARLGVSLPTSYKMFLRDFGMLDVEGEEFYGEWERGKIGEGIPSFVWATESSRKKGEIGPLDVRVRSTGFGPQFVLDCTKVSDDGESPVDMVSIGRNADGERILLRERIAESFGAFFLAEIRQIISGL